VPRARLWTSCVTPKPGFSRSDLSFSVFQLFSICLLISAFYFPDFSFSENCFPNFCFALGRFQPVSISAFQKAAFPISALSWTAFSFSACQRVSFCPFEFQLLLW
jgi:hypothetical protein